LQDALKAARQAVGALGESAAVSSGAAGDDKAALAAQIAALRRLQAAQKGLQGDAAAVICAGLDTKHSISKYSRVLSALNRQCLLHTVCAVAACRIDGI
jgi:hypothetical protein